MSRLARILRFEMPYEQGSRSIMPVHVMVYPGGEHSAEFNAIIDLRAPRSALNLLWSLAPQYAGSTIRLEFDKLEYRPGSVFLRGVRILR